MADQRYARAQAQWLAREYPDWNIEPERVMRVTFHYEAGYSYSSYTYSDGSFHIEVEYDNGERFYHYPGSGDDATIDLTRMVVEGLALLEGDETGL